MSYREHAETHKAQRDQLNQTADRQVELLVAAIVVAGGSEDRARDAVSSFRSTVHLAGYHDGVVTTYQTLADVRGE